MNYKFYEVISKIYDERKAFDNVQCIYENDRWMSYDKYAKTATICKQKMIDSGLCEIEINELKADGKTLYADYKVPRAWEANKASLALSTGEILCNYEATPCSLSMYSTATPKGGIDAELAIVDDIKNPPDNLKGKLILVNTGSAAAVDLAKEKGAVGILTDCFPLFPGVRDSREEMKGIHRWDCMPDMGHSLFAFSLAPEQGDMLRDMAKNKAVTLHAEVDAGFTEGALYIISGAIKGTNPDLDEIILYAHLDEPGANDNASGCGGLLELMRSIKLAVDDRLIPQPKNTIRLVMGPEYNGSIGYIHYHPNRKRLTLISADMIGNEAKDRTFITTYLNPLSNRSYVDGAIVLAGRRCDEFYKTERISITKPYWAGSDNFVSDPSLNTPSVFFGNYPAQSYHSSGDNMDRIEANILKRNSLIVGDCAYMLAIADEDICNSIAKLLNEQGKELIDNAKSQRRSMLCKESLSRSLNSLKRLVPDYDTKCDAFNYNEEVPEYAKKMGADKVPYRIFKGPVGFTAYPELREKYSSCASAALCWTDGERNIWNISLHTAAELDKASDNDIKKLLELHIKMFEDLKEYGYTDYKK